MSRFQVILSALLILCLQSTNANNLKSIEQDLGDSLITAKITAKFAENQQLNPLKISISTDQNIVTLKGYVPSKEAFVMALRLAKNTSGVKEIDSDELDIKKVNTSLTDAYITTKVEATILKAKVLDDESIPLVGINVKTDNGVVTLTGEVKQIESIDAIIKRTSAIKGVKKIISQLKITRDGS